MRFSTLALALALAASPGAVEADDPGRDDGYAGEWPDVRPAAEYDVSVDFGVQGGVTVETFHGALAPYGQWVVVANYGRVWRPSVAAGWRPYYYGRWEWTNEGWLWVSDEPWGWATYHYGRWTYDPRIGWIWVPGTEWAPAWVAWRSSGDVIGWAPLAPGYSVYVSTYPFVDFWWTFVPCNRFVSIPVYRAAFAPHHARHHFHATAPSPARPLRASGRPAAGTPAWGGPAPRLVEERMGRPVTAARIVAAPAPGARARPGEIAVYRPDRRAAGAPSLGSGRTSPGGFGRESRGARALAAPPRGGGQGAGPAAAPAWRGRVERQRVGPGLPGGGLAGRPEPRGGGAARGAVVSPRPEPRGGGASRGALISPAPRGGGAARDHRAGPAPAPQRGGGDRGEGRGAAMRR